MWGADLGGASSMTVAPPGEPCSGTAGCAGELDADRVADMCPAPSGTGLGTAGGGGGTVALRMFSRQLTTAAGPFSSLPPAGVHR